MCRMQISARAAQTVSPHTLHTQQDNADRWNRATSFRLDGDYVKWNISLFVFHSPLSR